MQTFKKKNIKDFKVISEDKCNECDVTENDVIDEEEIIDELVTSTGGSIGGDEKNVNNSEIKTAPQTTSDEFNAMAIQPNRYLYGVTGSAYSVGSRQGTMESINKIAKDKILRLLENSMEMDVNGEADVTGPRLEPTQSDNLPQSVQSKLKILIDTVDNNKLNPQQVSTMLDQLLAAWTPKLDYNSIQMLKDKLNA